MKLRGEHEGKIKKREITRKEKRERRREKVKKIKKFISENEDRKGVNDNIIKSNITDNESGKMPSSHGVIQGYNGIAAADDKHQIVVHAEANGSGNEQETFSDMLDGIEEKLNHDNQSEFLKGKKILADSGFHSEKNMETLSEKRNRRLCCRQQV